MATVREDLAGAFLPSDYGALVDRVVDEKAVSAAVSTVVPTGNQELLVPVWVEDPSVGFYAEGSEITPADPTTAELSIVPKAVKGLVEMSNESADDTSPALAERVGLALARQVIHTVDAALFAASAPTNGYKGVLATGGYSEVAAGSFGSLDPFVSARYASEAVGGRVDTWVVAPDVAETVSKLKTAEGSNQSLLTFVSDGLVIAGVPVIVSPHVPAGEAYGFSREHTLLVRRTGTTVARSADAAFSRDSLQLRVTARMAMGFTLPAANVRIYDETTG